MNMQDNEQAVATHTISVYVANKPGVLARVAQVFARLGKVNHEAVFVRETTLDAVGANRRHAEVVANPANHILEAAQGGA